MGRSTILCTSLCSYDSERLGALPLMGYHNCFVIIIYTVSHSSHVLTNTLQQSVSNIEQPYYVYYSFLIVKSIRNVQLVRLIYSYSSNQCMITAGIRTELSPTYIFTTCRSQLCLVNKGFIQMILVWTILFTSIITFC